MRDISAGKPNDVCAPKKYENQTQKVSRLKIRDGSHAALDIINDEEIGSELITILCSEGKPRYPPGYTELQTSANTFSSCQSG